MRRRGSTARYSASRRSRPSQSTGRVAGASGGTMMPARAANGCSALTTPAARSTTTRRLDGPITIADETVTGRRPRTATTTRTSTAWPGVTASSVGGGAKAANGPVGSESPAGCAAAEICRPSAATRASTNCCSFTSSRSRDVGIARGRPRATDGRKAARERRHRGRRVRPRERVARRPRLARNRRQPIDRASRRRQAKQAIRAGKRGVEAVKQRRLFRAVAPPSTRV